MNCCKNCGIATKADEVCLFVVVAKYEEEHESVDMVLLCGLILNTVRTKSA